MQPRLGLMCSCPLQYLEHVLHPKQRAQRINGSSLAGRMNHRACAGRIRTHSVNKTVLLVLAAADSKLRVLRAKELPHQMPQTQTLLPCLHARTDAHVLGGAAIETGHDPVPSTPVRNDIPSKTATPSERHARAKPCPAKKRG